MIFCRSEDLGVVQLFKFRYQFLYNDMQIGFFDELFTTDLSLSCCRGNVCGYITQFFCVVADLYKAAGKCEDSATIKY
jgi:hypothetical protein